jgi:hypothetical protein
VKTTMRWIELTQEMLSTKYNGGEESNDVVRYGRATKDKGARNKKNVKNKRFIRKGLQGNHLNK